MFELIKDSPLNFSKFSDKFFTTRKLASSSRISHRCKQLLLSLAGLLDECLESKNNQIANTRRTTFTPQLGARNLRTPVAGVFLEKGEQMLLNNYKLAFINQIGDFKQTETSRYFLVSALIVAPKAADALRGLVREKLKGASVLAILKEFQTAPFHVVYVAVDKQEIYPASGLSWEDSFIKYTHKRLYKALAAGFPSLEIISPKQGKKEFMDGFARYVDKKVGPLFNSHLFSFADKEREELLQLAEFIGTTIFGNFLETERTNYLKELAPKILFGETFPGSFENYLVDLNFSEPELDKEIAQLAVGIARQYIAENEASEDLWEMTRVLVLKRLLFQIKIGPQEYLNTPELMRLIKEYTGLNTSEQEFRSQVTAKLRDRGVLIASSDKGYKIPLSTREVFSHCNRVIQMLNPMLARLQKFRESILYATKNKLDVLDQPEYQNMRLYFTLAEELERSRKNE